MLIPRRREREFYNDYTETLVGGESDIEVRQKRGQERREKEAKATAAQTSRTGRSKRSDAITM